MRQHGDLGTCTYSWLLQAPRFILSHDPTNLTQWKSFDFFQVAQISLPDDETRQLFESNEISSVCAGSDSLFLGSSDGWVSIIGKSWKVVKKFQAHEAGSITNMRQVEGTSLLLTVAVSTFYRRARRKVATSELYTDQGCRRI